MERIHEFNTLLTIIIVVISIFVLALVSFIVLRFRASRNPTPSKTSHNTVLEVLWTVVPIMILVVIAVPSFRLLYFADRTGNPEMTIKAIGHQWYWEYQYPDAKSDAAATSELPSARAAAHLASLSITFGLRSARRDGTSPTAIRARGAKMMK